VRRFAFERRCTDRVFEDRIVGKQRDAGLR
jgi:hypothetical protein